MRVSPPNTGLLISRGCAEVQRLRQREEQGGPWMPLSWEPGMGRAEQRKACLRGFLPRGIALELNIRVAIVFVCLFDFSGKQSSTSDVH